MVRGIQRLSALRVEKLKEPGYHADGAGLWLQVTASGTKSWIFRFMLAGRAREMGLGAVHTIGLAEARIRAAECRKLLLDGIDPIEARNATKQARRISASKVLTFDEAAKAYIASHRAGWKNAKHAEQWENTLATYVSPVIGGYHVENISTALVRKVLDPIWQTKSETAARVRGRIESILDYWAATMEVHHYANPARWKGHLENLLPHRKEMAGAGVKAAKREHHAALPYTEIGGFFVSLREQTGIAAKALEFTILTAARTSEAIGARWDEIDFKAQAWTVPAERMKAKKEHRSPLSGRAIEILRELSKIKQGEFVFPGRSNDSALSNMAMLQLLKRMGRGDLTVHGFRSTFRDWAAEQTNYPREVAEMALAHTVGDKVEAAYRRGDLFEKRRRMMEDWATYCARKPQAAGDVVPIRRKKSKAAA